METLGERPQRGKDALDVHDHRVHDAGRDIWASDAPLQPTPQRLLHAVASRECSRAYLETVVQILKNMIDAGAVAVGVFPSTHHKEQQCARLA